MFNYIKLLKLLGDIFKAQINIMLKFAHIYSILSYRLIKKYKMQSTTNEFIGKFLTV